jgi:hypothetical protein
MARGGRAGDAVPVAAVEERANDPYSVRRWRVHLGLIVSFGLALLVITARMGLLPHIVAGLCFAGLVGVHLAQRRRTVTTLVPDLARPVRWRTRRGRLALSDAVLAFLAVNVVVSGVVDWITGRTVMVPIGPLPPLNWHTSTSLFLVAYLIVHIGRRLGRLRHSRIR